MQGKIWQRCDQQSNAYSTQDVKESQTSLLSLVLLKILLCKMYHVAFAIKKNHKVKQKLREMIKYIISGAAH